MRDEDETILYDEEGKLVYEKGEVDGIAIWRVLTAPVRVFASEDSLTIIMISVFLLIMSGVFNLLDKTGGIKVFIGRLIHRLANKGKPVVCICVLIFMLFGSFFGMFEELVTAAQNRGTEIMELEFIEGNDRARHLYEKFGFRVVSEKPNAFKLKDGTYRNEFYMQKYLRET